MPSKKQVMNHLAQHQDNHLKRFNLDIIMSYGMKQRKFSGQLRCMIYLNLKLSMEDLLAENHNCTDKDCGNLENRIVRRTQEF